MTTDQQFFYKLNGTPAAHNLSSYGNYAHLGLSGKSKANCRMSLVLRGPGVNGRQLFFPDQVIVLWMPSQIAQDKAALGNDCPTLLLRIIQSKFHYPAP